MGQPGIPRLRNTVPLPRRDNFRSLGQGALLRVSSGPMRQLVIAIVGGILWCASCGGAVGPARLDETQGGSSGFASLGGRGGAGTPLSSKGGASGGGVTSTYVEPDCPVAPLPTVYSECDPLGESAECGPGTGCYPITSYPSEPCGSETFQMLCLPSGAGQQWASCDALDDCAAGYICVVTGDGTECLKMCDPEAVSPCPKGLFCDGVDLQGIGICF